MSKCTLLNSKDSVWPSPFISLPPKELLRQKGDVLVPSLKIRGLKNFRGKKGANLFCKSWLAVFIFGLTLLSPLGLFAQDFPAEPTGMVSDFANLLSSSERQQLENKLRNYRDTTTNVIAIATLPDLKGYVIDEVATQLFNDWKMWHEDRYNGVLLLVAPNERKIKIEVGYGLEGAIPDVMAGRVIREIITPAFKGGDYYAGLEEATSVLIQLAQGEFKGNLTENRTSGKDDTASIIILFLFIAFVIYASSRGGRGGGGKGRRRRTFGPGGFIWLGGGGFGGGSGGGSFGGGGGGFGGFSGGGGFGSGGGGASGGW